MNMKHTPGPWRMCGKDRGGCVCGMVFSETADCPVATATFRDDEIGEYMTVDQMKVNARLIAAAPDLLAAAIAAWRVIGDLQPSKKTVGAAYALHEAITKATGADE